MNIRLIRFIGACLSAALVAACGGAGSGFNSTPTSIAQPAASRASLARQPGASGAEKILYRFKGGADGANPAPVLIDVTGTLFGTTVSGGGSGCSGGGCGTVFKVDVSGKGYSVLYRFKGGRDGAKPVGVIEANGVLYGTTSAGGSSACDGGCGTVFQMRESGKGYRVVYSFKGGIDGASPDSILNVNGTLYGATYGGDVPSDYGTVYALNSTTGAESVLYSFKSGADGAYPANAPIDVNGVLYGTTTAGGRSGCGSSNSGCGVVFRLSTSGKEHILYSFGGGTDGAMPYSVIDSNGAIYGATNSGGASCNCGTLFKVSRSTGAESVLYTFQGGTDGAYPANGPIEMNGKLYGATTTGGLNGDGTVYAVTSQTGAESVLYSFSGGSDGAYPGNSLTGVSGTLYGTTVVGGGGTACKPISSFPKGCGTLFKVAP